MSSAITIEFEKWKANEAATGKAVILNEFVFAYIPNLDITKPVDRNESLPEEKYIVDRKTVNKTGLVSENAVAYSVTLGTDVGDYEFNWIGLLNKESGTLAMITHAPTQKKIKTQDGQQGNVLMRSFLLEFEGAAKETLINTTAETWQIDFTARLMGIDESQRLANLDNYGIAAFIDSSFLIVKHGDVYIVKNGIAYINGLRGKLEKDEQLANLKNTKIFADFSFQGNLLSHWETKVNVIISNNLADYIDEHGFQHYVSPIAEIDNDGNIKDLRTRKPSEGELMDIKQKLEKKVDIDELAQELGDDNKKAISQSAVTKAIEDSFVNIPDATTSVKGKTKLSNTIGNSESEALTPKGGASLGFGLVGSFENGLFNIEKITNHFQQVYFASENALYRWAGALPKPLAAGTTPLLSGGVGAGKWVKVGSGFSVANYGFVGELEGDCSGQFNLMLKDALALGIKEIHFPEKISFNLEKDIIYYRDTILSGLADIKTANPNNRYIKCHQNVSSPQESGFVNIGDLSSFASAVLRNKYIGNRKTKVAFIGDSLMMGMQHRNDFSGISDRLKSAIRAGAGAECEFYNRAIAGSAIGEFLGKIPTYADPVEVHGTGEEPWITDKDRTWLSYIEDIQPDLVVIAFGMNAPNANDTHFCRKARTALKALNSNPSIIWVTTPMRTIDASKVYNGANFGTYPGNEYSNSAGLTYGLYGKYVGDTVIDVNKASSITMLGIDPTSCSIKPEPASRHKTTGNATTSVTGGYINATLNNGAILSSQEYVRDGAVELKIDSLNGILRLRARNDVNSINSVYFDISESEIKLNAPTPSTAEMGVVKQVTIDTIGKTIRFQFVGTRVFISVDNVLIIDVYDTYASQFTSNIIMQAVSNTCVVSNVRFYKGEYKTNPPLLTPDEVFSPDYGLGGNSLNHPNLLGVEYMYGTALKDFPKLLSSAMSNNALVKKSQEATLSAGVTGEIISRRIGDTIYVEGREIDGSLGAYETLTTIDILYCPEGNILETGVGITLSGSKATPIHVRIGPTGRIAFSEPLTDGVSKFGFSISYSKNR